MDLRPILSTLARHKMAAGLIVLEVALTCAIVCNAVFLIGLRLERLQKASGVVEQEIVRIESTGIGGSKTDAEARTQEDIAALQSIPGVRHVSVTNQVPFGFASSNVDVRLSPDQLNATTTASTYYGTPSLVDTLGVDLIQGRDFLSSEYVEPTTLRSDNDQGTLPTISVITTQSLAASLFPDASPLGKSIYALGRTPLKIVGIIRTLARPNEFFGANTSDNSMLVPIKVKADSGANFLLRVSNPAERGQILNQAVKTLQDKNRDRIILEANTFQEIRTTYFRNDTAMAWLLATVCVALLLVTAFGIVGLASFWVAQRARQIGVRRALGGTRRQILRYFQAENFILSSIGIAIGMMLGYGINQLLMNNYELPRMPLIYLPVGAAILLIIGQLSVLAPAMRAASVPPAVATRSR